MAQRIKAVNPDGKVVNITASMRDELLADGHITNESVATAAEKAAPKMTEEQIAALKKEQEEVVEGTELPGTDPDPSDNAPPETPITEE